MAETAEATTFEQAFEDAVKEHSTEQAPDTEDSALDESKGDTEAESQTSEETAKAGDPTKETAEDTLLTEEEVAKLSDEDRETYKRMQTAYTQKTQKLSAERKQFEAEASLFDAIKQDPEKGLSQLAEHLGLKVQIGAGKSEELEAATDFGIPKEFDFLKPVFDAYGKSILARIQQQYQPVIEQSVDASTQATLREFEAVHPNWKKHEPAMTEWMGKYQPKEGVSPLEFLEEAYKHATADVRSADELKKFTERVLKASSAAESDRSGVSTSKVAPKAPQGKNFDQMFDAAFDAAKRGESWE